MLGDFGLADKEGFVGIDSGAEIIQYDVHYLFVVCLGVKRSSDSVIINHSKNGLVGFGAGGRVGVLKFKPVFYGAKIIAQMQFARRSYSRKDFNHDFIILQKIKNRHWGGFL